MTNEGDPETEQECKDMLMGWLKQSECLESEFGKLLKQRFETEGMVNVELVCHLNGWELKALQGTHLGCQTSEQVKAIVQRLVREFHHDIDPGLIVALVLGNQLGAAFRLR